MKKIALSLALGLSLTFGILNAAEIEAAVAALNAKVQEILQPFQNEKTQAGLRFLAIQTDEVRALRLALDGLYKKTGTNNTLEIRIDQLSYDFGDGTAPATKLMGYVGLDFTKVLSQESLNEMIPGLEEALVSWGAELSKDYGDAIKIAVEISEKQQDKEGNFIAIKGKISGKIDLAKLPTTKLVDDVMLVGGDLEISVDLRTGATVSLTAISNPLYKGFRADHDGLKEYLDKLRASDAEMIKQIGDLFSGVDGFAAELVEKKQ